MTLKFVMIMEAICWEHFTGKQTDTGFAQLRMKSVNNADHVSLCEKYTGIDLRNRKWDLPLPL